MAHGSDTLTDDRFSATLLRLRHHWAAWIVVWTTRVVLAILVIPTGIEKLLGVPFHRKIEPWATFFFDALYAAGAYWRFLGACEIAAGVLLLIPRFTLLGALMYVSIAANLLMITMSLHFLWTAIFATSLMLSASVALIIWDWAKLKPILGYDRSLERSLVGTLTEAWTHGGFKLTIAVVAALWVVVEVLDFAGLL